DWAPAALAWLGAGLPLRASAPCTVARAACALPRRRIVTVRLGIPPHGRVGLRALAPARIHRGSAPDAARRDAAPEDAALGRHPDTTGGVRRGVRLRVVKPRGIRPRCQTARMALSGRPGDMASAARMMALALMP